MVKRVWLLAAALMIAFPAFCFGKEPGGDQKTEKTGILLVAFGTSVPEAQAAFDVIEKKVRAAFPDIPVRWAYTSHVIRNKLRKQGKHTESVESALARMMDDGFTHAAVQSLHVIGGFEFHDLQVSANAFAGMSGGFKKIVVGYPLLAETEDLAKTTEAIIKTVPKERTEDEAVILIGHGTHHPSDAFYEAMMYRLQKQDPNIYMGTVAGSIGIGDIRDMLVQKGVKKAYLMPFMSVAGDHARNDMAGDDKDSWKSILESAGIRCVPILKGIAEYDEFVQIWTDHLKTAMDAVRQK